MEELHAIVSGRVQLVMYRDFATRKANKLGLVGFVRNLPNGTVEVIAQGEKAQLERYVEYLNKGSVLSHVENVAVEWRIPQKIFDSFELVR